MRKAAGIILILSIVLGVMGCRSQKETAPDTQAEAISVEPQEEAEETAPDTEAEAAGNEITEEQALEAVKNYCYINNPDLKEMEGSDEYTIYWEVSSNEDNQIVVLWRSYTGAQTRYYIDPASGEAYVTELVPGIIDEETKTDESLNVRDYMD